VAGCFVYVSNAGEGKILAFRISSPDAEPEFIQEIQIADGPSVDTSTPMALSPDRRFLYAVVRTRPLPVAAFLVDRKVGRLTPLGRARLPASAPYVVTDRTGRFLFSAGNPGAIVALSAIGSDGRMERYARQVVHIGYKVHCVAVHESNRFVYVSSTEDGQIFQFAFDAGLGRLAPLDPPFVQLAGKGDPRHMVFSPDGRFLYVTTEAGGKVACFAVDPVSGRLTEKSSIGMMPASFARKSDAADIHLTPDGRFLYATERVLNTIVGYRVDGSTGGLSLIEAIPTEAVPRAFAIAPDGSFLLVAGLESGRMTAYSIDRQSGRLAAGASIAVGPAPNWIEFVEPA
jgi:6-phosphogluconolactonase